MVPKGSHVVSGHPRLSDPGLWIPGLRDELAPDRVVGGQATMATEAASDTTANARGAA